MKTLKPILQGSAAILTLSLAPVAHAQVSTSENLANFGTLSQLNSQVIAASDGVRANACVPTSVANGLMFLDNSTPGGVASLVMGNGYPTASQLISNMGTTAAGSTYPNEVSGLATYLGPGGQNTTAQIVGGQISNVNGPWGTVNGYGIQNNTVPTAMAMYNWLLANDAVEFWINWSGGGAHSVTLDGISINAAGTSGTLSFLDPFGGAPVMGGNNGSAVSIVNATWTTVGQVGNEIYINGGYTGGAANNGADPDNTARSSTGYIVTDLVEAVPEPGTTTLALVGGMFTALMCWSRAKRRAPQKV